MSASHPPDPDPDLRTDRLRRVSLLLDQALALPPAEREHWLRTLPPDAGEFEPVLRGLLARAAVETDHFMRRPVVIAGDADAPTDQTGDLVGSYRLLRELGAGGMASVWLAERADGVWQRRIALKLPRSHHDAWGLAQRMAHERDILGSLTHPHIARLYDAGVTDSGRPYLAMEVVDGVAIDAHARARRLSVAERLRLFRQVLQAVSHAHARLVVHRDLKPSNILVTTGGDVRLLDFGVARLLDHEAVADSALTQRVGRALTPDYASPEQIRGEAITVGSDVYSLGVVLYELLTDQRPYALKRSTAAALEDAIVELDVPPPSTRVAPDRPRVRALRGDIDTIIAKALKKNPAERYASVDALAADIDRHLAGLPVLAQPDSWRYRAGKFVRRHRMPVAAAMLAALAVATGVAGTVMQSQRAEQQAQIAQAQRDRALRELSFAEASEEFMRFLLSQGADRPLTMRDVLAHAGDSLRAQFAGDPVLRARMQLMVADLYGELADFEHAEPLLLEARALLSSPSSAAGASVALQVDCTLAGLYAATGRLNEAEALFDSADARLRALADADQAAPLTCLIQRSTMHRNRGDAAASLADAQAAIDLLGPPRPGLQTIAVVLDAGRGDAYAMLGRHREAIATYERGLAALERLGRGRTTVAATLRNNLAVHLVRTGQLVRADAVYRQALTLEAERHDAALATNRGRLLVAMGRSGEAMPLFEQALQEHRRNGDQRGFAYTRLGVAQALCSADDPRRCDRALADAAQALSKAMPAGHAVWAMLDLAAARASLTRGRPQQSREQLQSAQTRLQAAGDSGNGLAHVLAVRARAEQQLGDREAARRYADEAVAAARKGADGITHTESLGAALLAQGIVRSEQGDAAGAQAALGEAVEQLTGAVGNDAPATNEARARLGGRP